MAKNPNGIPAGRPRVATKELPWEESEENIYSEGVVATIRNDAATLSALFILLKYIPRVAHSSQPWAKL
jgi:hypothetical protein